MTQIWRSITGIIELNAVHYFLLIQMNDGGRPVRANNSSSWALCPGPIVQLTVRCLGAPARHAPAADKWGPGTSVRDDEEKRREKEESNSRALGYDLGRRDNRPKPA
jgi:hypothetical protein